ncbi:unnamed protein product [Cyprideis torosa]|uniref:Uncharacterized protein n=1 Tax=Cyprideis torosa TaxID=163714 RepID=A0A7R8W9F2_9CRUS|nr:unnamed protein product [Cyprideis torosa]CAG0887306.1 unnamed protein product [Cyprideis torosa]
MNSTLIDAGSIHVNFILVMMVEIPGNIIAISVLNRWGRRRCQSAFLLIAGVSCVISGFLPEDYAWLQIVFMLIGKTSITASLSTVYIVTGELFPTTVRGIGLGTCSSFARLGSAAAPYVVYLLELIRAIATVKTYEIRHRYYVKRKKCYYQCNVVVTEEGVDFGVKTIFYCEERDSKTLCLAVVLAISRTSSAQTSSTSVFPFGPLRPLRTLFSNIMSNFRPLQQNDNQIDEQPFQIGISRPGFLQSIQNFWNEFVRRRIFQINDVDSVPTYSNGNRRQDSDPGVWSRLQTSLRDRLVGHRDEFDVGPPNSNVRNGYSEGVYNDQERQGGFIQRIRDVFDNRRPNQPVEYPTPNDYYG